MMIDNHLQDQDLITAGEKKSRNYENAIVM